MNAKTTNIRVPKTAEIVAGRIRRQIVSGDLREGDALASESALMEEFSISRPTMREAYRILESEGLITIRRGYRGGARIMEPSAEAVARAASIVLQHRDTTLADVLEARVVVEAPTARMLAGRRNRVTISRELQMCSDAWVPEDPERFNDFNLRMAELTDNQTVILVTAMLEHVTRAAAVAYVEQYHEPAGSRLEQRTRRGRQRVIELVRAGDVDAAETMWRLHLQENAKVLAKSLGGGVVDLFD